MKIKVSSHSLGVLEASTPERHQWSNGYTVAEHWGFTVLNDTIYAMAHTTGKYRNGFGFGEGLEKKYLNDKADKDKEWYWNVRNGLELLCDRREIIWVEKE